MIDSFGFFFAMRLTSSSIRLTSSDDWVETSSSRGSARWSAFSHHDEIGTYSAITAATASPALPSVEPRASHSHWTPSPASRISGSSGCSTSQANFSPAHE